MELIIRAISGLPLDPYFSSANRDRRFFLSRTALRWGATRNPYLMQYQSHGVGLPVNVSRVEDLAAWGVARLAMLAKGVRPADHLSFMAEYHPKRQDAWQADPRRRWRNAIHLAESDLFERG
ncbi:MAG: FGGY-family carbohydrate kinase [Firmicutes bacterium]|nr:FGGY-family carbohydrate kinase [Bacillota bacterium]